MFRSTDFQLDRATDVSQLIPLELLAAGETGRIHEVQGAPEVVNRLHEMGLNCGTCVKMLQAGSPCILAVGNHRLSFRGERSAVIFVELCAEVAVAELCPRVQAAPAN